MKRPDILMWVLVLLVIAVGLHLLAVLGGFLLLFGIFLPIIFTSALIGYGLQALFRHRKIKLWIPWAVIFVLAIGSLLTHTHRLFSMRLLFPFYGGAILAIFIDLGIIVRQRLHPIDETQAQIERAQRKQKKEQAKRTNSQEKQIDESLAALKKEIRKGK